MNNPYLCKVCNSEYPNAIRDSFCSERCRQQYRVSLPTSKIGIPSLFRDCSLENYIGEIKWLYPWLEKPVGFVLIASPVSGNGKTHLAVSILKILWIDKLLYCRFQSVVELLKQEYASFNFSNSLKSSVAQVCKSIRALVLDDLGAENVTEFSKSLLYEIVDYRYTRSLPTIVTTNLGSDDLKKKYGDRLASRIFSGIVAVTNSEEQRLKKMKFYQLASN